LVGFEIPGAAFAAIQGSALQRDLQGLCDRTSNLVLNHEDVVQRPVILVRPCSRTVRNAYELGRDAQILTGSTHAALEYVGNVKPLGDFGNFEILSLECER
jgi:hypothetical protein